MKLFLFLPILLSACFTPVIMSRSNKTAASSAAATLSLTPLSGAIGTVVTLSGLDFSTMSSATLGGSSAIIAFKSSSQAKILIMPGTSTNRIQIVTSTGSITSSDFFTVGATSLPTSQQGTIKLPSDNTGVPTFGNSIAVSGDGKTAIIGGPDDNTAVGAAWVFVSSGTSWSQQGLKLIGTPNSSPHQGYRVAISADGNTVASSGWQDNGSNGAVWVFTRSGTTWSQESGKLIPSDNTGAAQFGRSVALSADGNTLAVGGLADAGSVGAVWIFVRSGSSWTQYGNKLVPSDNTGSAAFGSSVALSSDGNYLAVGGPGDNSNVGAAWVFSFNGSAWSQQGSRLIGSTSATGTLLGSGISINSDGSTVLVGGYTDAGSNGAAWVFTRSGSVWTQQGTKLTGTGISNPAYQGYSVSLTSDGNIALVGAYNDNLSNGAAIVYKRTAGVWTQPYSKLTGTGNTGAAVFGYSVSINGDGSVAVIGGNSDGAVGGAFWAFIP